MRYYKRIGMWIASGQQHFHPPYFVAERMWSQNTAENAGYECSINMIKQMSTDNIKH